MTEPRITPLPRDEWTDEMTQAIAALLPPGVDRRCGDGRVAPRVSTCSARSPATPS